VAGVEGYGTVDDAIPRGYSHGAAEGTDDWRVDTAANHTTGGARSFAASDVAETTDKWLALELRLGSGAQLTFWHRYHMEEGYDGGVLEISTDGGSTWTDLGSAVTAGGYTGTISSSFGNPLGGRSAWTGTLADFGQVSVDLSAYTGNVEIRWRMGLDSGVGTDPWYIDDIGVANAYVPSDCSTWTGPCSLFGDADDSGAVTTDDLLALVEDLFDTVQSAACPDPDGSGSQDAADLAAWLETIG